MAKRPPHSKSADDIKNGKAAMKKYATAQKNAFQSMIDLIWDHVEGLESSAHIVSTEQRTQASTVDKIHETIEEMMSSFDQIGTNSRMLANAKADVSANTKALRRQVRNIDKLANKVAQLEKDLKAEQNAYRVTPLSSAKFSDSNNMLTKLKSSHGGGDNPKRTAALESLLLTHLKWMGSGIAKLLQSPYSDGATVHGAKDLKKEIQGINTEITQAIIYLDPDKSKVAQPSTAPSTDHNLDATLQWIRIFAGSTNPTLVPRVRPTDGETESGKSEKRRVQLTKARQAQQNRCELTSALWCLTRRVTGLLERNAAEQRKARPRAGRHICVIRNGPWMLLEHITLPRDLLASTNLLKALMDLAAMLRTWFQRTDEVTVAVVDLAVRMNKFDVANRVMGARTQALDDYTKALQNTVVAQNNTIQILEQRQEYLAETLDSMQGTMNKRHTELKGYTRAIILLTDQMEALRKSIGLVDDKTTVRGLQPPYPTVMGGEYPDPDAAPNNISSAMIIRCLSCEQRLDPLTASRVMNQPITAPRAASSASFQPTMNQTPVDLSRYDNSSKSPLSLEGLPTTGISAVSSRVPMHARPSSAAVIRHNKRVLAANAKAAAKRPTSAHSTSRNNFVVTSTQRPSSAHPTRHFESAAFDAAPQQTHSSFRARRPLAGSPKANRRAGRSGRLLSGRNSADKKGSRIEWQSERSPEAKN